MLQMPDKRLMLIIMLAYLKQSYSLYPRHFTMGATYTCYAELHRHAYIMLGISLGTGDIHTN